MVLRASLMSNTTLLQNSSCIISWEQRDVLLQERPHIALCVCEIHVTVINQHSFFSAGCQILDLPHNCHTPCTMYRLSNV